MNYLQIVKIARASAEKSIEMRGYSEEAYAIVFAAFSAIADVFEEADKQDQQPRESDNG